MQALTKFTLLFRLTISNFVTNLVILVEMGTITAKNSEIELYICTNSYNRDLTRFPRRPRLHVV